MTEYPHRQIRDPLTAQYIDHLVAEGIPPNTVAARARVLRSLGNAGTATREEVESWWASRRARAPATRANDLANLRAFYKWADRWEHREDDPTKRLDPPRVDRGLPRPLSRSDLHRLLRTVPEDLRRAICLGAYAGLRVSEAAGLMWDDVNIETKRARVTGKGGKTRLVALGTVLLDQLLPEMPGANVVSGSSHVDTPAVLQRRVNRAMKAANVDGTFHALRHRYGTLAYQETRDLVAVGKQMGHASVMTTSIYSAASDDTADVIAEAVTR